MFSGRENRFRLEQKQHYAIFLQWRIPLKFVRIMPLGLAKLNQKDYFCAATFIRQHTAARRFSKRGILFMCRLLYNSQKFL